MDLSIDESVDLNDVNRDSQNRSDVYENYRVWTVLKQMCHDRGYLVTEEMMNMSYDDWFALHGERDRVQLSFPVHKDSGDPMDQMLVVFPSKDDVSRDVIKKLYERMRKDNIYRAIIVVYGKIAAMAKRAIQDIRGMTPPIVIEQFYKEELMLNVTKHCYVPRHEILTPEEKEQLLARYKIKDHNLPLMQENDAISRYYGLVPGQVVRIIRPSPTAGLYVTYRLVSRNL
eukprot:m.2003 g.2003  ORF g.2003 m.2003 type:complete len:229 (+) comp1690_c0_seq1:95-781(+)